MGSIDAACIAGFLCRLCSEMHRTVIHIYGDQGQKHDLARKINAYLPVTVNIDEKQFRKIIFNRRRHESDLAQIKQLKKFVQ